MQNTNKIIGGIAVIALILSVWAFFRSPAQGPVGPEGQPGQSESNGQSFGATFTTNAPAGNTVLSNGTILPNPSTYDYLVARAYQFVASLGIDNGTSVATNVDAARASIVSTSTVLCALTNPRGATSSIMHLAINFTTAPTSTLSLVVGTSSSAGNSVYATSSGVMTISVPVSATNTPVTWDPGVNNDVIGPSGTVVFGVGAASSGIWYGVAGACSGTFVSDN